MRRTLVCSLVVVCGVIAGTPLWSAPVTGVRKQADGVLVTLQPGVLQLQVMSGTVIHVTYAVGNALPELKSYTVVAKPRPTRSGRCVKRPRQSSLRRNR